MIRQKKKFRALNAATRVTHSNESSHAQSILWTATLLEDLREESRLFAHRRTIRRVSHQDGFFHTQPSP
jgi:hypothetical protein